MQLRRGLFSLLGLAISLLLGLTYQINAAEVRTSERSACVIELVGEIVSGDYDKVAALARTSFPDDVVESTVANTICLDSPGGNLYEAVQLAKLFFEEGIGTVVDAGQECYSACAVMFMMGVAKGDEVSFINRRLNVSGILGFHRPFMPAIKGIQSDIAADAALEILMELLIVANNPVPWQTGQMMKSDLIQEMLRHRGEDFFLIDTLDKVGRWEIELDGVLFPPMLTEEQAFYACQNALQWKVGTTANEVVFSNLADYEPGPLAGRFDEYVVRLGGEANREVYQVTGLKAGYAEHGCIIAATPYGLSGCGVDEYTSASIGRGMCTEENFSENRGWVSPIAIFRPSTRIVDLSKPQPSAHRTTRCVVYLSDQSVDSETCRVEVSSRQLSADGALSRIVDFTWPSGSRTVVVEHGTHVEINGARAIKIDQDRFSFCYLNSETRNIFCFDA